ncbi:unnamed protein product [Triticum aestivum]|uniref:Uncharacterized protein n=1 Tax=Triticum aestivum TaxID=4565 RepID=A0A7H4LED5_WHEAT|nr:unnamed protein product [Triticum aestivum]
MDSPQKEAGSTMDGETRHLLLPVSVTVAKKLRMLSEWRSALGCSSSRASSRCRRLTDAEEALDSTLKMGMLFCGVVQAASALLIPRHRRWVRRALDYLALALTIGGHCIYAAAALLVPVADPGDVYLRIAFAVVIVIFAAGDIIGFLALLLLGGEA